MLILTEKPSVAKDFAAALGCTFHSGIYSNNTTEIVNCVGHLFRLQEPDFYDSRFKSWNEIPCIPNNFSYTQNESTLKQAELVLKLLNKHRYDYILIATDADREGEIIARECLQHANINDYSKIKRFWVSQALTKEVILKGIRDAEPLENYNKLSDNGFARQHSDWLTGYNFTRYVSIAAKKKLSVGRVKTAVLSAIEKRCSTIENFISEKYFQYKSIFRAQRCTPEITGYFFKDNKISFKKNIYETRLKNCINKKASLISSTNEDKELQAPLLYNLNSLQKDAYKYYNLTPDETLKYIQILYEQHKCVSYPRTPSKVMGSSNVELVKNVFNELAKTDSLINEIILNSDISLNNKKCFNDKKLEAHHAIIPLKNPPKNLSKNELAIYNLIKERFCISFLPAYTYSKQTIILNIDNNEFKITGKKTKDLGWKKYIKSATLHSEEEKNEDSEIEQELDNIDLNNLFLSNIELKEKFTKPPKYFNEASILTFMENPKSEDENIGKLVGLGTPATRHTFIPELINNGYIELNAKKNLLVTQLGKTLIEAIRSSSISSFADIEETTKWENELENDPKRFEKNIKDFIISAIQNPFQIKIIETNEIICPRCHNQIRLGKTKNGNANWFCTGYTNGCTFRIWETFNGTKLSEKDIKLLCEGSKTNLKKFISKKNGAEYKARLYLDKDFQIQINFK